MTEFYEVEQELTQLGIGEALVTALNPKGVPMPTARTMMRPPMSLMAQLDRGRFEGGGGILDHRRKYAADANPASAEEMLPAPAPVATGTAQPSMSRSGQRSRRGRQAFDPRAGAPRRRRLGRRRQGRLAVARSGAFNTILKSILRGFGKR